MKYINFSAIRKSYRPRRTFTKLSMVGASLLIFGASASGPVLAASGTDARADLFASAAKEFGVPQNVLMALSYNESRWQSHGNSQSADGGFGLMDLRTQVTVQDGRGKDGDAKTHTMQVGDATLDQAVSLLHVSKDTLKNNDQQNLRGAAAVLADDAKKLNDGKLPSSANDWYDVVAKFNGNDDQQTAQQFADDVYDTVKKGASSINKDGKHLDLGGDSSVKPDRNRIGRVHFKHHNPTSPDQNQADCPHGLDCRFVPAAYAQDDPNDPSNYGNYDIAHRPKDMQIKYIVIHDTEGSYDSTVSEFLNPQSYVSANYVIRSSDGAVTQMVPNQDVAWHAGDWYVNMHSIGIEHEGFATQGSTWYTEAMYKSSAKLVRYLADEYHIPLDRQHIIGHDNVPGPTTATTAAQHWDPGPYWDWDHYMDLVRGGNAHPDHPNANIASSKVVTIAPKFAENQPPVDDCSSGTCTPLPAQGSNFVYLRTAPDANASLLSDPIMHSDNSPGTTNIADWSATADTGQTYAVAERQGDWTAIWFGGQKGWFYNPGQTTNTDDAFRGTLTPKAGMTSIPVYGRAYPEAAAYPTDVPVQTLEALNYNIPAGQLYTTSGKVPTDYFYDQTINFSLPHDHIVVKGDEAYYQISFNHREGYVKASDVTFTH